MSKTSLVPLSAAELRDAVRNSRRYDPLRLSRVLGVDERAGLVEVQANTPWRAIADRLRPDDPSSSIQPSSAHTRQIVLLSSLMSKGFAMN